MKWIALAHRQWPHSHPFQPRNVQHLRFWLECQAGHYDVVKSIRVASVPPEKLGALLLAFTVECGFRERDRIFVDYDNDHVVVKKTRSIRFFRLAQPEFRKLDEECTAVLMAETGLDPEALLQGAKREA